MSQPALLGDAPNMIMGCGNSAGKNNQAVSHPSQFCLSAQDPSATFTPKLLILN